MKVEILNANVLDIEIENVTMKNGEQRTLQKVTLAVNGNGVECHGVEVWGQDVIQRLGLQKKQSYNISCTCVPRLWGGRYTYSLQAYKADLVQQQPQQQRQVETF